LEPIGQIDRTYIVAGGPEGMYLIDQHAAHERLYYERALEASRSRSAVCQQLAVPHPCQLSPEQMERWEAVRDDLNALGFEVEPFGRDTLLVRGVPVYAGETASAHMLVEVLEKMREGPTSRESVALATAACKSAVKAGDRLSVAEMRKLFEDLAGLREAGTCPHGRPTLVVLSRRDLARMFGRH
ncbi:MAG: DNA mismatch repair protein MutL, partial [Bacillota bacterium]